MSTARRLSALWLPFALSMVGCLGRTHAPSQSLVVAAPVVSEIEVVRSAPVMRPLWLEYPNDPATYGVDNAYLLGRDPW